MVNVIYKILYRLFSKKEGKKVTKLPVSTKKYEVLICTYYFDKETRKFRYGGVWYRKNSYKTLESAEQACRDIRKWRNRWDSDRTIFLNRFKARKKID